WTNERDETLDGVFVETLPLPDGIDYVSGSATTNLANPDPYNPGVNNLRWSLGTIEAGEAGSFAFTIMTHDPWDGNDSRMFHIDGKATTQQFGEDIFISARNVVVAPLVVAISDPAATAFFRGNRVPVKGWVETGEGSAFDPSNVALKLEIRGTDAETGQSYSRQTEIIPLDTNLRFSDQDGVRLGTQDAVIIPIVADTEGHEGIAANTVEVGSAFYKAAHAISNGSLPALELLALIDRGETPNQWQMLDQWKQNYPDFTQADAERHTDAAERLDQMDQIARMAITVARQHYSELAEGIGGIVSVWDFVNIISAGMQSKIKTLNRVGAGLFGNHIARLGFQTGVICDRAMARAGCAMTNKVGLNSLFSRLMQSAAMQNLQPKGLSQGENMLFSFQWQLGSGAYSERLIRLINDQGANGHLENMVGANAAAQGIMEQLVQLMIEPLIRLHLYSHEEALRNLGHSGPQDLALVAGEIAQLNLQSQNTNALLWSDFGQFSSELADVYKDTFTIMEFVPNKLFQDVGYTGRITADIASRAGASYKAETNILFLQRVLNINREGMQSVLLGNLNVAGLTPADYGALELFGGETASDLRLSEDQTGLSALYDRIITESVAPDGENLAELGGDLNDWCDRLAPEEIRRLKRSAALELAPAIPGWTHDALTSLSTTLADLTLNVQMDRISVATAMLSLAADCDDIAAAQQLINAATLAQNNQRALETWQVLIDPIMANLQLPDMPILVDLHSPQIAETESEIMISALLANIGYSAGGANGRVELIIPPKAALELVDPASQDVHVTDTPTTVSWRLRATAPGQYLQGLIVDVYGADNQPADRSFLNLFVEEAGDEQIFSSGEGGTISSGQGTAIVEVPAGGMGFDDVRGSSGYHLFLSPVWAAFPSATSFTMIRPGSYLIQAVDLTANKLWRPRVHHSPSP
ncbi:MAG TPA: hypothetical protein PLB62_04760, partial [Candidatus Sumerlaeota bacterium]|nr:hypothetical protein [Candidatus Sumerlaeota bacterium]